MRPAFASWSHAAVAAGGASGVMLALFYHWFAVADRYAVFLYEHLGAAPFDAVTRSRYWMAGLVAAGVILLLYTGANWVLGRLAARRGRVFCPPSWTQVWLVSAAPLTLGILWITTTQNAPTLPLGLALQAALSALVGLGLAFVAGRRGCAETPADAKHDGHHSGMNRDMVAWTKATVIGLLHTEHRYVGVPTSLSVHRTA